MLLEQAAEFELDDYRGLTGNQTPTHLLLPLDVVYSDGTTAIEIYESCAESPMFDWQVDYTNHLHGRRQTGHGFKWSAQVAAVELSRQNGKSVVFEARALSGTFVFGEKKVVYSTHTGEAARNAFERIWSLIDNNSELRAQCRDPFTSAGREEIRLRDGRSIKFLTRTAANARSLTADCLIVDEAQHAMRSHMASVQPTLSSRTVKGDPQIIFGGSAGYQHSEVLADLVRRCKLELERRAEGLKPRDARLLIARWAADLEVDNPADPEVWAKTNPLLGHLMTLEAIEAEYRTMGADVNPIYFAAERLGVGDYPREEGEEWAIPRRRVEAANLTGEPDIVGPVMFALEVHWNRQSAAISACGRTADGTKVAWLQAAEVGTAWVIDELQRLTKAHENFGVVLDPQSPANSLVPALRDAGVPMVFLTYKDITAAWGTLYDALAQDAPTLRLLADSLLMAGFAAAEIRDVSGGRTWKRTTRADSTAVIALTWAAYMFDQAVKPAEPAALPMVDSGAGHVPAANAPQFNVRAAKF